MKHLGDISQLRGGEIPVVDVIIGGSPCQDLSVAGKRAGLEGERSGLFLEQIRVIKEMREHDRRTYRTGQFVRPRYAVWENVAGAFSSPGKDHAGEDFAAVLTEFVRIAEPEAPAVAVPDKGWPMAGCLFGEDGSWSVAWRLFDAQFWGPTLTADGRVLAPGTPQRRQRVALVADFGGLTAPEILFEREGLHRDPEPGTAQGQEAAGEAADRAGGADRAGEGAAGADHGGAGRLDAIGFDVYNQAVTGDVAKSLTAERSDADNTPVVISFDPTQITSSVNRSNPKPGDPCNTLTADARPPMVAYTPEVGHSLKAKANCDYREDSESYVVEAIPIHDKATRFQGGGPTRKGDGAGNGLGVGAPGAPCPTLSTADRHMVCCPETLSKEVSGVDCRNGAEWDELNGTIQSKSGGGFSLNCNQVVRTDYIVRRLTPMECERLQGFPDNWTKLPAIEEMSEEDFRFYDDVRREAARVFGKNYKTPSRESMVKWWNKMASGDSHRYQSLGNSICLPGWKWICKRICAQYERDATLGSLFDGIGGFPLIWERLNGRGMCLWASEVEPFQIAVTRTRFRAEEIGKWL